jgi:hypothetical protein
MPHHPFIGPYAECVLETRYYRNYNLEVGTAGVLVSSLFGGVPCMLNGAYMLFASIADAEQFVDALASTVPPLPQQAAPVEQHGSVRQTEPLHLPQHAPFRLSPYPISGPRQQECVGWKAYRGYNLTHNSKGCTIGHPEYGAYKINGCYVVFPNVAAACAEIDRWYNQNRLPQRLP